jgi:hypothetical protein
MISWLHYFNVQYKISFNRYKGDFFSKSTVNFGNSFNLPPCIKLLSIKYFCSYSKYLTPKFHVIFLLFFSDKKYIYFHKNLSSGLQDISFLRVTDFTLLIGFAHMENVAYNLFFDFDSGPIFIKTFIWKNSSILLLKKFVLNRHNPTSARNGTYFKSDVSTVIFRTSKFSFIIRGHGRSNLLSIVWTTFKRIVKMFISRSFFLFISQ